MSAYRIGNVAELYDSTGAPVGQIGLDGKEYINKLTPEQVQSLVSGGGSVAIGGDVTINAANADTYNGKLLIWSTAATVTLAAGLPTDFGFNGRPPASGNASVASANTGGLPTIDGATTTVTRALASNKLFAVVWLAANTFTATGT